jgi:hypothetical protein
MKSTGMAGGCALIVLTLTGCAGGQRSAVSSTSVSVDGSILGRWVLSTPNAPSCGLEFVGSPGARAGKVAPDGGCPGSFFMSRLWAMDGDALALTDGERRLLALFKPAGAQFEGQTAAGMPVTLAR